MENTHNKPVVLVLAGHDPTGGAGIQADIEAVAANGCRAVTVLTCMTVQNAVEFRKHIPVQPQDLVQQTELVLAGNSISACKIGLLAEPGVVSAVEKILLNFRNIPVVFDPVICSGTGKKIMADEVLLSLQDKLLQHITVLTPNSMEARVLAGIDDIPAAAHKLLKHGCKAVLITGTHEPTDKVINTLYLENEPPGQWSWDRLAGIYHGSGCTLSAAITARLARGEDIRQAVIGGQQYTWDTLKHGIHLGHNLYQPDRYYRK